MAFPCDHLDIKALAKAIGYRIPDLLDNRLRPVQSPRVTTNLGNRPFPDAE